MDLTLKVWRQENAETPGRVESHKVTEISPEMSFLEMLDVLNNQIIASGKGTPIQFDSDCREGICGTCSLVINGRVHGPQTGAATCQLHMRSFQDGDVIMVEPFRAKAFPVVKDLVVDRSAFDKINQSGGFVSSTVGGSPDANAIPIPKPVADLAMDAAQCIGCGACVATCKNASAMLFVSAKVSHLALLPQGQAERKSRVLAMTQKMDELGFGNCTNEEECEAVCPKEIGVRFITKMNREYLSASS